MATMFGYPWRIITNVIFLAIVLYILAQLHERPETVVVPILGLLYVRIHALGFGMAGIRKTFFQALDEVDERLKWFADASYMRDHAATAKIEKVTAFDGKDAIDIIYLGIVSGACLWKLYTALPPTF
jgi:hypothetical protein